MATTATIPATPYNPGSTADRCALAASLQGLLQEAGFALAARPATYRANGEAVYFREIPGTRIAVKVYTTIVPAGPGGLPQVRGEGKDAIRVCAVYRTTDGKDRGIVSDTRVNRTGDLQGIATRTLDRMRTVWKAAATGARCYCGAPKFTAKSGKVVCADACWARRQAA